jgi:hypothetical protein
MAHAICIQCPIDRLLALPIWLIMKHAILDIWRTVGKNMLQALDEWGPEALRFRPHTLCPSAYIMDEVVLDEIGPSGLLDVHFLGRPYGLLGAAGSS